MKKVGGYRKGAGRKLGSANKKTRDIADKAAEDGITPLEFMMRELRLISAKLDEERAKAQQNSETISFLVKEGREFAKDAAPFIHPRLQAMTLAGDDKKPPVRFIIEG